LDQITLDRVREVTAKVVAKNPKARNPRDFKGMCLYNGSSVSGFTKLVRWVKRTKFADHCLGGEVLINLDLRMPREGSSITDTPDIAKLTGDARTYLSQVQRSADTSKRTWSEALLIADETFDKYYGRTGKTID
jgi:hypothetical protein